jgi:hypothetical protein
MRKAARMALGEHLPVVAQLSVQPPGQGGRTVGRFAQVRENRWQAADFRALCYLRA